MNNPDYLVIPFSMFLDKKLKDIDCKVYGIIYWLNGLEYGARAANKTIAKMLNCSVSSIEHSLTRLSRCGCVKIEYKDTSKRHRICITPMIKMSKMQTAQSNGLDPSNERERSIYSTPSNYKMKRVESHKDVIRKEAVALLDYFIKEYSERISANGKKYTITNWGRWISTAKSFLKESSLKEMKELIDAYFESDDKFYKSNAWSINLFFNEGVINKLNQSNV
mgnify:CR=1 FL=1